MSLAATIRIDAEKFLHATETDAEKLAAEFELLWKKAPTVIQTVDNFVNETAPVIEVAVGLANPEAEAAAAGALSLVETGLAAIAASAKAANSGNSLLTNLQNFAGTVPKLLTGIEIKNPALQTTIESIVNLVTNEAKVLIPAVEAWVAQIAEAKAPATTAETAPAE